MLINTIVSFHGYIVNKSRNKKNFLIISQWYLLKNIKLPIIISKDLYIKMDQFGLKY